MSRGERKELELLERLVDLSDAEALLLGSIESVLFAVSDKLSELLALLSPPIEATTAVLSTQGDPMAATATLTFVDTTGAPATPPKGDGSGLSITFSSDNPAVTLGPVTPAGDTATATITGTAAFNLSAVVANVSGVALLDDDGTTPFVQPTAIPVAGVSTPQAVTAVLSST